MNELACPNCGHIGLSKYGFERNGSQRFRCTNCSLTTCKPDGLDVFIPDGYQVKGTSTLYRDGKQALQWVKTSIDAERQQEVFREALAGMKERLPRLAPVAPPPATLADLANLYVITDYHIGMLAHHTEGGADWDLKIAEKTLNGCFSQMISSAPTAETAIICQLGDFLHQDSIYPQTGTFGSSHILDADSRFTKIVRVAIKCLRNMIDMALKKHKNVYVILAEGNHDVTSSIWLREMMAALYEDDSRVNIDTSELPYYVHKHGETMLAFHHGHLKKMASLTATFAAQFAPIWGTTKFRYAHCGHLHHTHIKEDAGMIVTQHQTLTAKDSYSARHGYHAVRGAQCITYHVKHGQVATNNVTPEMLM